MLCQALLLYIGKREEVKEVFPYEDFPKEYGIVLDYCEAENETGFFLYTGAGIYENIEEWILQVPSDRKSLSKSNMGPVQIKKEGKERFAVWDKKNIKYHYIPEEVEEDREIITLRIVACEENIFFKNALTDFQIQNLDIQVEYEILSQEAPDSPQEMNTLIQQVNSGIVSERAADLYVLDYLPWEDYQEKGCFLDLRETIEPMAQEGVYFQNILTGTATEQGLYTVPLYFRTQFVICREEAAPFVTTINGVADYLKKHPESLGAIPEPYQDNPAIFLAFRYHFYGQDLYDEGQITYERVGEFLEAAFVIYQRIQMHPDKEANEKKAYFPGNKDGAYTSSMYRFLMEERGDMLFYPCSVNGMNSLSTFLRWEGIEIVPVGSYQPAMLLGIHANTKHKESTVLLLQYLLEYYEKDGKIDSHTKYRILLPGISVNQQFVYNCMTETNPERYPDGFYPSGSYEDFPIFIPETEDMDNIVELLESFHTYGVYADEKTDNIYAILRERGLALFLGERSLEEVTEQVYQGIRLFYEERK